MKERFVEALRDGHALYGLDSGCGEWRARPGEAEIELEPDAEDDGTAVTKPAISGSREASPLSIAGHLRAGPDREGRIFGFSYHLYAEETPVRLRITGRGRWSPAPGVLMRDPDHPDMAIIGVGSYCVTDVGVRFDAQDAVTVGRETWYLTRAACLRAKPGAQRGVTRRGCSRSAT